MRQAVERISNPATEATSPKSDSPTDPLAVLIANENLYHELVFMANSCKKLKSIRSRVRPLLKEAGIDASLISSEEMVEMLLPHLKNFKGSKKMKNIKSALY